jgi:hypothetical protein
LVGDIVWMASKHRHKCKGHQIAAQIIPNNSFIMVSGEDLTIIIFTIDSDQSLFNGLI